MPALTRRRHDNESEPAASVLRAGRPLTDVILAKARIHDTSPGLDL